MKNKISKKAERRKVSIDFHQRVVRYDALLAQIEREYSDKRLVPQLRSHAENSDVSADLFAWARKEEVSKYAENLHRRANTIRSLRAELANILEISSAENSAANGTNFSTVIFDESV